MSLSAFFKGLARPVVALGGVLAQAAAPASMSDAEREAALVQSAEYVASRILGSHKGTQTEALLAGCADMKQRGMPFEAVEILSFIQDHPGRLFVGKSGNDTHNTRTYVAQGAFTKALSLARVDNAGLTVFEADAPNVVAFENCASSRPSIHPA